MTTNKEMPDASPIITTPETHSGVMNEMAVKQMQQELATKTALVEQLRKQLSDAKLPSIEHVQECYKNEKLILEVEQLRKERDDALADSDKWNPDGLNHKKMVGLTLERDTLAKQNKVLREALQKMVALVKTVPELNNRKYDSLGSEVHKALTNPDTTGLVVLTREEMEKMCCCFELGNSTVRHHHTRGGYLGLGKCPACQRLEEMKGK